MSSIELNSSGENEVIVCQLERHRGGKKTAGDLGLCSKPQTLVIDVPRGLDFTTADLYFEMKENWVLARHEVQDGDDCALSDEDDSEDELV